MTENRPLTAKALDASGAFIVGATSGVGLASAKVLARSGVPRIVLAARNPERGTAAQEEISALGAECLFVSTDALNAASMARAASTAESFLDGIDIAVCTTAPRIRPELFQSVDAATILETLTSLALPSMHMAHAVLPGMRERHSGAIVNLASDAAKTATPGESIIGAGMAAIVMFTRTIAMEEKKYGIRANVLTPSLIGDTGLTSYLLEDGFSGRLFAAATKRASLGIPNADELAELVTFLCRPEMARLTGQAISLNGGISAA